MTLGVPVRASAARWSKSAIREVRAARRAKSDSMFADAFGPGASVLVCVSSCEVASGAHRHPEGGAVQPAGQGLGLLDLPGLPGQVQKRRLEDVLGLPDVTPPPPEATSNQPNCCWTMAPTSTLQAMMGRRRSHTLKNAIILKW